MRVKKFSRYGFSSCRLDTNDNFLTISITITRSAPHLSGFRIQECQFEVTVIRSAPPPVKVVESVSVITVTHKGMPCSHGVSSMKDWASGLKFGVYYFFPVVNRVTSQMSSFYTWVIVEIRFQSIDRHRQSSPCS